MSSLVRDYGNYHGWWITIEWSKGDGYAWRARRDDGLHASGSYYATPRSAILAAQSWVRGEGSTFRRYT